MRAVAPGGDGGVQRGLVVDLPLGVLAAGILQRAAQVWGSRDSCVCRWGVRAACIYCPVVFDCQ